MEDNISCVKLCVKLQKRVFVIFIELFEKLQLRLPSSSEKGYSVSSSVVLWLNASFGSGTKVFFLKNALLCFFIIIVHF